MHDPGTLIDIGRFKSDLSIEENNLVQLYEVPFILHIVWVFNKMHIGYTSYVNYFW